jgi:NADH-quinone oxidoreductase subunit F
MWAQPTLLPKGVAENHLPLPSWSSALPGKKRKQAYANEIPIASGLSTPRIHSASDCSAKQCKSFWEGARGPDTSGLPKRVSSHIIISERFASRKTMPFHQSEKRGKDIASNFIYESGEDWMVRKEKAELESKISIRIAAGTDGVKAGAQDVFEAFTKRLAEPDAGMHLKNVRLFKTGVMGLYGHDVLVEIRRDSTSHVYGNVKPSMVDRLVEEHLIQFTLIPEWLIDDELKSFFLQQDRVLTANWSGTDPENIHSYIEAGGYSASRTALGQSPFSIVSALKRSGLRERTHPGFPVYLKWETMRKSVSHPPLIVAIADSGDPQSFISRDIMDSCPHAVIEGMIIAGHVLGASRGVIYVRKSHLLGIERLEIALDQAREEGLLGKSATGDGPGFDIELIDKRPSEICAWRSSFVPYGLQTTDEEHPLFLAHDVETWINIPNIVKQSKENRKTRQTWESSTKLFSLGGIIPRQGIIEVPIGTPLRDVIFDIGGYSASFEGPRMIQVGGPTGGLLSPAFIDQPLDFEDLNEVEADFGSGSIQVMPDDTCVVDQAVEMLYTCFDESCGACLNHECGDILHRIQRMLNQIRHGGGSNHQMEAMEALCMDLRNPELCGTTRTGGSYVLSTLLHYGGEYDLHIREKRCPAHKCLSLRAAPCQRTCPAGIDIPSYLALIGHGRFEEAVELIRRDNPLVWTCGLICPAPCEGSCLRGEMDQPISIRAMKGFAAKMAWDQMESKRTPPPAPTGAKVAVVGSGPGGLSCAYYLALKGYRVTIFEALSKAGGLLQVGIPEYRLPKKYVQKEIDHIRSLGVDIKTGVRVGKDVTIDELRDRGFEAFFLAVGAHKGFQLRIEGEDDFKGVYDSITFLRNVSLDGGDKPADKVIVVGGGNAAVDAARTCVRLGCSQVTMAYRRTHAEMPAWEEEIQQALEEGVQIKYLTIPMRVIGNNGHVEGMECLQAELSEPDASGRRRPIPVTGSNFILEAGAIITAIGQQPDLQVLSGQKDVEVTRRSTVSVSPSSLQTTVLDIFAGGDAVSGPATVVEAVAAGKLAAQAIDLYIRGEKLPRHVPEKEPHATIDTIITTAEEKNGLKRPSIPHREMDDRIHTFKQVELGLTQEMALNEAKRCLRCDMCAGQGLCQMVCQEMGVGALKLSESGQGRMVFTDFLKPGELCIGCGSCTTVCPTNNMWIKDEGETRRIYCCGTLICELPLERCSECGKPYAPKKYLDFLEKRAGDSLGAPMRRGICEECARKRHARLFA